MQLTELNARQWIDITFVSKDGSKIDPSTINGNEFKLSGSGVGQIKVNSDGFPELVGGVPLLIQGSTWLKTNFGSNALALDQGIYGLLLILFIIYMPKGVLGTLAGWRAKRA